jgi:hypothetical protein
MKKIVTLIVFATFAFSSCEKDDICDANTSTTPRLVIEFYDYTNPSELKTVTNLKVIGEGMTNGVVFNSTATDDSKYLTNSSKIYLPLKTDADASTYRFVLNFGSATTSIINTDQITFYYNRSNVYVSRACGYKTLFAFNVDNPLGHKAIPDTSAKWIQYITVQKTSINNENETHVKIYF